MEQNWWALQLQNGLVIFNWLKDSNKNKIKQRNKEDINIHKMENWYDSGT